VHHNRRGGHGLIARWSDFVFETVIFKIVILNDLSNRQSVPWLSSFGFWFLERSGSDKFGLPDRLILIADLDDASLKRFLTANYLTTGISPETFFA
jgi:hypothetical protein